MVTIKFPASDVPVVQAEIARIDAQIRGLADNSVFFGSLLNGRPAQMLYSPEELSEKPYLESEQKVLIPAIIGSVARDLPYENILFAQLQTVIDKYEAERRLVDGTYPDFTMPVPPGPGSGNFDENLIQLSGVGRISPLFDPNTGAVEPANPGQMFGGTAADPLNEVTKINDELAQIAVLQTGSCQAVPVFPATWPVPCQTALAALKACLLARYDSSGPLGILVAEVAAISANPDLSQFPSNPVAAATSEEARIQLFLTNLASVPPMMPVPALLLSTNAALATARKSYLQSVRIPEMSPFLNTNPGYYGIRFAILRRRVAGSGTAVETAFLQKAMSDAAVETADLQAQRAFLVGLLP